MAEEQEFDMWGEEVQPGWHRAVALTVLRTAVICTVIVLLSLVTGSAVLTRTELIITAAIYLLFWGSLYVFFFRHQMKLIRRASFPSLRAAEALIVGLALFITIFAKGYYILSVSSPAAFSEPLDHLESYYFTITVLATVGFGDIVPQTNIARIFAMVQMLLDLIIIAVSVRLVTREVQRNKAKRRQPGDS